MRHLRLTKLMLAPCYLDYGPAAGEKEGLPVGVIFGDNDRFGSVVVVE